MKKSFFFLFINFVLIASSFTRINAQDIFSGNITWTEVTNPSFEMSNLINRYYSKARILNSDAGVIGSILSHAPFETTQGNPLIINLPNPSGSFDQFYVYEYSMMEAGLQAQFPEMRTYSIKGITDPYASGKIDVTMFGFHAMVLTVNGDWFIEPVSLNDRNTYVCFLKSDYKRENHFECGMPEKIDFDNNSGNGNIITSTGQQLRTYRLANGATGEYTAVFGGTVAAGQAAIVTAINRVNGVYETDFSVRMTLVANNTNIVFTNSSTDPYTNSDGYAMLSQNQTTCDNVSYIGSANYDIGHVFSTGGGGIAGLGVVCQSGQKAYGVTGLPSPIGDPFYIDYVAHEIGHQFGGNHSFNSSMDACGGGNRNAPTAWEPGSGSTIMGYAGICNTDDLQSNSDAYFHSGNVTEIVNYTQSGYGNTCPVITNTGNTPPVITMPTHGLNIPISTPFELTGSATDNETPGSLTYCWEEFDTGPSTTVNAPTGNAPAFRSFTPVTSPSRVFPKLSALLNNSTSLGETLVNYARRYRFRLTVRDNSPGGGGIAWDTVSYGVINTGAAFAVTSPNTAVSWNSAVAQTVTWNVSGTTASPINCSTVNIKLSTNGGNTYAYTLVSGTSNDGTQSVMLPPVSTSQARIKVEAAGNVFFDISNVNFTITNPAAVASLFTLAEEGYYNTGTGKLNMRDTVRVYARNVSSPYAIVDSGKIVIDSSSLSGVKTFSNLYSGTYYFVIRHRNALETWSKAGGESFTRGVSFTYNFTTAVTQAYNSNLKLVGTKYCNISGDINDDYVIDVSDIVLVYNDALLLMEGYVSTDVTGDRFVDVADLVIVFNNSVAGAVRQAPPGALPYSTGTVLR